MDGRAKYQQVPQFLMDQYGPHVRDDENTTERPYNIVCTQPRRISAIGKNYVYFWRRSACCCCCCIFCLSPSIPRSGKRYIVNMYIYLLYICVCVLCVIFTLETVPISADSSMYTGIVRQQKFFSWREKVDEGKGRW